MKFLNELFTSEKTKQSILKNRQEKVDELTKLCASKGHRLVSKPGGFSLIFSYDDKDYLYVKSFRTITSFFIMKRTNKLLPLEQSPDFFDKTVFTIEEIKEFIRTF